MVWLLRPPYLRYVAAAALIVGALWLDLRPSPDVDHPFLAADVPAGAPIEARDIDWRSVPANILPVVEPDGIAAADIPAGTPLVPALLTTAPAIPTGWFALEIPVPDLATPGTSVRIVVDAQSWIDGVVIALADGSGDFLSQGRNALVAIPGDAVAAVADAAGRGQVTVLLGG